jgi:hypothetical protein
MSASRQSFEEFISEPPYEASVDRYPQDELACAWPGQYIDVEVQRCWEVWQRARSKVPR